MGWFDDNASADGSWFAANAIVPPTAPTEEIRATRLSDLFNIVRSKTADALGRVASLGSAEPGAVSPEQINAGLNAIGEIGGGDLPAQGPIEAGIQKSVATQVSGLTSPSFPMQVAASLATLPAFIGQRILSLPEQYGRIKDATAQGRGATAEAVANEVLPDLMAIGGAKALPRLSALLPRPKPVEPLTLSPAPVTETAVTGTPFIEKPTGGVINASTESSTASVSGDALRRQMGEEASLRQQGEVAAAREPVTPESQAAQDQITQQPTEGQVTPDETQIQANAQGQKVGRGQTLLTPESPQPIAQPVQEGGGQETAAPGSGEPGAAEVLPGDLGFSQGFKSGAGGIIDNMYEMLFKKLQSGDLKEGGQPSRVLIKAKPLFDSGAIKDAQSLRDWIQNGENLPVKTWFTGTGAADKIVAGGFDVSKSRGTENLYGPGVYFTDNPKVASSLEYTGNREGAGVIPAHLDLKNPFSTEGIHPWQEAIALADQVGRSDVAEGLRSSEQITKGPLLAPSGRWATGIKGEELYQRLLTGPEDIRLDKATLNQRLLEAGFDGLTYDGGKRASGGHPHQVVVVFDTNAIRSSITGKPLHEQPRPAGPTAPGETTGRSEGVGVTDAGVESQGVTGNEPGPVDTGAGQPKEAVIPPEDLPYAGGEPQTTGVANRVLAEEAKAGKIDEIASGEGMSWQEMVDLGREQLNRGANPQEIANRFKRNKRISPTDFAVLRAERERLAVESNKAAQSVRDNPADSRASDALKTARKAETAWIRDVVQPAKTATSDIFRGMQGEAPIDASTFEGLRRSVLDTKGREPNAKEATKLEAKAEKVRRAQLIEQRANAKLGQEIERSLPKSRAPTLDELRGEMDRMVRELTPCK